MNKVIFLDVDGVLKMITSDTIAFDKPHGKETRDAPAPGATSSCRSPRVHPAALFILGFYDRLSYRILVGRD